MRRMLDPTKVGGIPSTIEFDKDGNREVKKNLGVEGKFTLKSLVSSTNPDGDITKELGGGGGSTIRITYTYDSFEWDPPSSDKTYDVGDTAGTYFKLLDENELPLQLDSTSVKTIGTATFIITPVQWIIGSNRQQALQLVCIKSGIVPANTNIRIYVDRVRVVSE